MNGWRMLLYKEVLRFWKVAFQTIAAPVLTSVLSIKRRHNFLQILIFFFSKKCFWL